MQDFRCHKLLQVVLQSRQSSEEPPKEEGLWFAMICVCWVVSVAVVNKVWWKKYMVCHAWNTPEMKKRTMKSIGAALLGA
jgi:hypothetical protein